MISDHITQLLVHQHPLELTLAQDRRYISLSWISLNHNTSVVFAAWYSSDVFFWTYRTVSTCSGSLLHPLQSFYPHYWRLLVRNIKIIVFIFCESTKSLCKIVPMSIMKSGFFLNKNILNIGHKHTFFYSDLSNMFIKHLWPTWVMEDVLWWLVCGDL